MAFVSILRIFTFALQNFWRNIWLSLVTIFILVLTLFSITLSSSLNLVAKEAITLVKSRVDVSVYFTDTALDADVKTVSVALTAMPEVQDVAYISKEDALDFFKKKNQDNPVIQQTLDVLGTNPLGATLVVRAKNIEDFPKIMAVLDQPQYKKLIQDRDYEENQQVIGKLTTVTDKMREIGLFVSLIFILIAALVIFNTIRITIYTYREEIGIMKLVGADNWFIRAPFVLESVLYAVIAGLVTMLIIIPLIGFSAPFFNQLFSGYGFDIVQYFQAHFWSIFWLQTLVSIVLAVVSSTIAITRYLRV